MKPIAQHGGNSGVSCPGVVVHVEFTRQPLKRVLFPEVHDLSLVREPEGEAHEPLSRPPLWALCNPMTVAIMFFAGWAAYSVARAA